MRAICCKNWSRSLTELQKDIDHDAMHRDSAVPLYRGINSTSTEILRRYVFAVKISIQADLHTEIPVFAD